MNLQSRIHHILTHIVKAGISAVSCAKGRSLESWVWLVQGTPITCVGVDAPTAQDTYGGLWRTEQHCKA